MSLPATSSSTPSASCTHNDTSCGKLKIQILSCFLNVPVKRPYVVVTLGDQTFDTSISEYEDGRWNETFPLSVSFHAQLFGTIQLDLYDSYMLLPDKHVGRSEIRLAHLESMPELFTNFYEIWDKKLSTGASSSVGRAKTMAANVGAIQVKIAQRRLPNTAPSRASTDIMTEEQLAAEFQQSLALHRERTSTTIQFQKYEENTKQEDAESRAPSSQTSFETSNKQATSSRSTRTPTTKDADESMKATSLSSASTRRTTPSTSISTISSSKPLQPHETDLALPAEEEAAKPNAFNVQVEGDGTESDATTAFPLLETIGSWTVNKETNQVLRTIGKLLAAFSQGFELSNMQILTGFSVLEKFYMDQPRDRTWELVEDLSEIELAAHFWKFSVASYGWKGLNFIGKGNGYFSDAIRDHSDALSIVEYLSIPKEDLLAYEFRSAEAFRPSYFIARDRSTHSIVLTIRGTMSAFDTMTDLVCEYEPWRGGLIHSGMKTSALWFFRHVAPQLVAYANEHDVSALYIVGHSLGAATAAILTIMLTDYLDEFCRNKDTRSFTLQCFGYAPACGLSLDLCEKYKEHIQAFVFADDVVSKLSYGSVMDVKELIIASAEAAQSLSIGQVLWTGTPEGERWKTAFERIAEARRRCLKSMDNPRLYVAGKVYQFWLDPMPGNDTRIVVERTDAKRVSTEVVVRRSIMLDHLPTNFDVAFRRAREALMLDRTEHHQKHHDGVLGKMPSESKDGPMPGPSAEDNHQWITVNGLWEAVANFGLKKTTTEKPAAKAQGDDGNVYRRE